MAVFWFLLTKHRHQAEAHTKKRQRETCLVALDFELEEARRMVVEGVSVQAAEGFGNLPSGGDGALTLGSVELLRHFEGTEERTLGEGGSGGQEGGEMSGAAFQLMRLYVVTPDASSGSVVFRPRLRLRHVSACAQRERGCGESDCVWEAGEDGIVLPASSLLVILLPFAYPTSGCFKQAPQGDSADVARLVLGHACARENGVVAGRQGVVGEMLSGSLVVLPSS